MSNWWVKDDTTDTNMTETDGPRGGLKVFGEKEIIAKGPTKQSTKQGPKKAGYGGGGGGGTIDLEGNGAPQQTKTKMNKKNRDCNTALIRQ